MADDEISEIDLDEVDDFLEHFGVKGMKWGIRKAAGGVARVATAPARGGIKNARTVAETSVKVAGKVKGGVDARVAQRRYDRENPKGSAEYVNSRKILLKKPSEMTNDELRQLTQRMDLERKYSQMNPSTVKKGFTFIKKGLEIADMSRKIYELKDHPLKKLAKDKWDAGVARGRSDGGAA